MKNLSKGWCLIFMTCGFAPLPALNDGLFDPNTPVDASVDSGVDSGVGASLTDDSGITLDAGPRCGALSFAGATAVRAAAFASALDEPHTMIRLQQADGARVDLLDIELWFFGPNVSPTYPYSVMLWSTSRARCDVCVVLRRACEADGGRCLSEYLANGGAIVFDEASREVDAGRIAGRADTVRFIEWDFVQDVERDGGRCLEIPTVSFDGSWP